MSTSLNNKLFESKLYVLFTLVGLAHRKPPGIKYMHMKQSSSTHHPPLILHSLHNFFIFFPNRSYEHLHCIYFNYFFVYTAAKNTSCELEYLGVFCTLCLV